MTGVDAGPPREPPAIDPAPVGRRTVAALIDLLPVLALLVAGWVCYFGTGLPWWVAAALGAAALAWAAGCWWGAAVDGSTIGKRLLGLAEVQDWPESAPGPSRALGRLLLRGVLSLLTLGVAGLSYRWDPEGRERAWWDRLTGTRVAPVGSLRRPDPADLARWAPASDVAAGGSFAAGDGTSSRSAAVGDGMPPGFAAAGTGTPIGEPQPVDPSVMLSVPGAPPSSSGPRPPLVGRRGWVPGPVPAEPAERSTSRIAPMPPRSPDPASASNDRGGLLVPDLIGGENGAVPRSLGPQREPPAVPAAPGGPVATGASDGASGQATTSQLITGISSTRAVDDLSPVGPRAAAADLIWDTGRHVTVAGRVLIGRDPAPRNGERADQLVPVSTDSVGVSKTHLQLDVGVDGITVTDRRSTNGVRVVRSDGTTERCVPDHPIPLLAGDVVHFGGRYLTVAG